MVAPSMGKPAFVCRLIPVFSLKADLLFEETTKVIELIHKQGGYTFLLMCDNLRTNESCFKNYKYTSGSNDEFSFKHPVSNDQFDVVFLQYDSSHLLKNIRNSAKTVIARWSDLVEIYRSEEHSIVKSTNYATLYPTNFEKQKVSLAMNIFNEKTATALFQHGYNDTTTFSVTKLWNCLNVKSPDTERYLNDTNREPFRESDDERFNYIHGN